PETSHSLKSSVRDALFDLYRIIDAPLTFVPDLPLSAIKALEKEKIWHVIQLISTREDKLSKITSLTKKEMNTILKNITPQNVAASKNKTCPLSLIKTDLVDIPALESAGIETIDEAYFLRSDQLIQAYGVDATELRKLQEILAYPVSYHPKLRSEFPEQIIPLLSNGFNSLFYFYAWNPEDISSLIGLDIKFLNEIRSKLSFSEILKIQAQSLPVSAYYSLSDDSLGNYKTIEEVLFSDTYSLFSPEIQAAFSILEGSIAFIPDISISVLQNLLQAKIGRIIEIFYYPVSQLVKITNLTKKELVSLKDNCKFDRIQELRAKAPVIHGLGTFGKTTMAHLSSMTLNTIQDFYFLSLVGDFEIEGLSSVRQENLIAILDLSILYLEELVETAPQSIKSLLEHNIRKVIDFFSASIDELVTLTGLNTESILAIRENLNFRSLKRKTPGTALKAFFNDDTISYLTGNGWNIVEDLYVFGLPPRPEPAPLPDSSVSESEPVAIPEIDYSLIERVYEFLLNSITVLSPIGQDIIQKCMTNGIDLIVDFLYWPIDSLAEVTDLTKTKIRQFKKLDSKTLELVAGTPLTLIFESDVINSLEKLDISNIEDFFFKNLSKELFTPNFTLFTSLVKSQDFLKIPLIEIAVLPPELKKVSTKTKSLLECLQSLTRTLTSLEESEAKDISHRTRGYMKTLLELSLSPITYFSELYPPMFSILERMGVKTCLQFLTVDNGGLASTLPLRITQIREMKATVNADFLTSKKQEAVPLTLVSDLSLKMPQAIQSLDTLYFVLDKDLAFNYGLDWSAVKRIKSLLEKPISYHPLLRQQPSYVLLRLLNAGCRRIIDFLCLKPSHFSLLGFSESETLPVREPISLTAIEKHQREALSLKSYNPSLLTALEPIGIKKVEELFFLDTEVPSDQKKRVSDIQINLKSSVSFVPQLKISEVQKLVHANIRTVIDFILTNPSDLGSITDLAIGEIQNIKASLNHDEINNKRQQCVEISSIVSFGKKIDSEIAKLPFKTIDDILFALTPELLSEHSNLAWNQIERIKDLLNLPLVYHEQLTETIPSIIFPLAEKQIKTLGIFLLLNPKDLSDLTSFDESLIASVHSELDLGSINRKKKSLGISVNSFFDKSLAEKLTNLGIYSLEFLYFCQDQFSSQLEELDSEILQETLIFLASPVFNLVKIPQDAREKLLEGNVTRIIEFLYYPTTKLQEISGLSKKALNDAKKISLDDLERSKGTSIKTLLQKSD
ncbi:MAG: hypothetical protein ACFFBD_22315, partial [Candidatus Hodarchaeota archaeon]